LFITLTVSMTGSVSFPYLFNGNDTDPVNDTVKSNKQE
jgi:hypothetical protein